MKKNVMLVVGIIALLILSSSQKKEYKKQGGTSLMITNLENIIVPIFMVSPDDVRLYIANMSEPFNSVCQSFGYSNLVLSPPSYTDRTSWPCGGEFINSRQTRIHFDYENYNPDHYNINTGDSITLIYDGGQNLIVYLPEIKELYSDFNLYISTTGETYYDSSLTQDACTYSNGCRASLYSQFLLEKYAYINGGSSFNTFITNANPWITT